mmetsp:Transcript_2543/g.5429  ORF Transcript_2543/g.5429 Transcript_2543/m.5429 type:complete len:91 (-) Transcript_2543:166-438(-)
MICTMDDRDTMFVILHFAWNNQNSNNFCCFTKRKTSEKGGKEKQEPENYDVAEYDNIVPVLFSIIMFRGQFDPDMSLTIYRIRIHFAYVR